MITKKSLSSVLFFLFALNVLFTLNVMKASAASAGITVLASTPIAPSVVAGTNFDLVFHFSATDPTETPQTVFVFFIGAKTFQADHGPVPWTTLWHGSINDYKSINVPASTPAGVYRVVIGLYSGNTRLPLVAGSGVIDQGGSAYEVGTIKVLAPTTTAMVAGSYASFGSAGGSFNLNYQFSTTGPTADPELVFVHFLDSDGDIVFQDDHAPPVATNSSAWKGTINYTRTVRIPASTPAGTYNIVLGFYRPSTESRPGRIPLRLGLGAADLGGYRYQVGTASVSNAQTHVTPLLPTGRDFKRGVNMHFGQGDTRATSFLNVLKALGITSVRLDLLWREIEPTVGQCYVDAKQDQFIKLLKSNGIDVLLVLAYGHPAPIYGASEFPTSDAAMKGFVRYSKCVATHFKGYVNQYEVWNEPDIGLGTPSRDQVSPSTIIDLLDKPYAEFGNMNLQQVLKSIDPSNIVVGPTIANSDSVWLGTFAYDGGLKVTDGLSFHPYAYYNWYNAPYTPEAGIDTIAGVQSAVRPYNSFQNEPLFLSETGWPSIPTVVTESQQANYLARYYLGMPALGYVKGLWWYDIMNDGIDPTNGAHNFGLLYPNWRYKRSACAMKTVASIQDHSRFIFSLPNYAGLSGVRVVKYSTGGDSVFAIWTEAAGATLTATVSAGGAVMRVTLLSAPGLDSLGKPTCNTVGVAGSGSTSIALKISNQPTLIYTISGGLNLE